MNSICVLIAKIFIRIVWILREVAIAVLVFETNVIQLTHFDPSTFATIKKSTMDKIFGEMMDQTNNRGTWKRQNNLEQVHQALHDPSNNSAMGL